MSEEKYINMRLFSTNDMVKIGCNDCKGCSECCHDMGKSILLDPYDIYRIEKGIHQNFEHLLGKYIELNQVDGLVLPNLMMLEDNNKKPVCPFLNISGRCSIHQYRPGICRLFPLGRNYKENKLEYFLLNDVCPAKDKTKVKINKWIDTENIKIYEKYLVDWHNITKQFRSEIKNTQEKEKASMLTSVFLKYFYVREYDQDFYKDFYNRISELMG